MVFSSHQLELVERLCDEVVLIDHGRDRGAGHDRRAPRLARPEPVARGGPRRRRRVVGGHPRGDGGSQHDDGAVVLELAPSIDPQRVLDVARAAGDVVAFGPVRPSLAELFREVVS